MPMAANPRPPSTSPATSSVRAPIRSHRKPVGACVSADESLRRMSAEEEMQRSERVFQDYATLHIGVREWTDQTTRSAPHSI